MIDIKFLVNNPNRFIYEMQIRGKDPQIVELAKTSYLELSQLNSELENLRQQKNEFNEHVLTLNQVEKTSAIEAMKQISEQIDALEDKQRQKKAELEALIAKIPNLTWAGVPIGQSDADNLVTNTWGQKPEFSFTPKPYYELPIYKRCVDQEAGTKVMGSRGYYLKGDLARLRKVLFDWAEEKILSYGFEYFYVPLMLNEKTMTDIGNLPDFDGQLYEIPINENTNYYLVPSSEQSLMAYFAGKHLGTLDKPILVMANTTCFRKESGSYGKDQQGILRVHQFEKIEIDAICKPEDNDQVFALFGQINETIYNELGLHFRSVEVCSGDMPSKHYRQVDYEVWFPGEGKFREVSSNGSASDYQNRGLKITYTNHQGQKAYPWSLNCTGLTFRVGLAILEQFQLADGSVRLPKVIAERFGKEILS
jgi:seryl-tRNA synthetase